MNLAELSIKRPIFISCIVLATLAVGILSMQGLPVDMFPKVTFPVVVVNTAYPGAGPKEIEIQVSKPLEEEMSTLPGVKALRSINKEGMSTVVAEFTLETDVKYAEQQVRDRVQAAKIKLPTDVKEPIIRRVDPADQPILIVAFTGDLPAGKIYDVANDELKPKLEQVNSVGLVEILGGRKREVHVELDREQLKNHEISASAVTSQIAAAGQDIPIGKMDREGKETVFRALGQFKSLDDIRKTVVTFFGNDVPVTVADVGRVTDSLEDEKSRTAYNDRNSILFMIFRQSGANTVAVAEAVKARILKLNEELKSREGKLELATVSNGAKYIQANVTDVKESILIGVCLTIIVVFFFLGSGRSTLITGLALPNSILGAFILMALAGFTVNIMTLLALSLSVGLLIDDAIVVRENIFRHNEMGKSPVEAALVGTKEVTLAVIATTLTVISVFGPIGFLKGVVGQFFREFGLTICFIMMISLFDAFTMAPMLSAYFAKPHEKEKEGGLWASTVGKALAAFERFQTMLEDGYARAITFTLRRPKTVLAGSLAIFIVSLGVAGKVPKTFLPPQDFGEFMVALDMPPGTSLEKMDEVARKVDAKIRANKEVHGSVRIVGNRDGEANQASFYIELVSSKQRPMNTSQFKDMLRGQLKEFAFANPVVKDIDHVGAGQRPFNVNIIGSDLEELEAYAAKAFEVIRKHPGLKDPDISYRTGKPEFQVALDGFKAKQMGISSIQMGQELRTLVEGTTPAVFREEGREYDIRVRLQEGQRNLKESFNETYVPNINRSLIRLSSVAKPVEALGPSNITRQDRGRYIQISGDLTPGGVGMGGVMKDISQLFESELKLPQGMRYAFVGQAEDFKQLMTSMLVAAGLGILFIYLVLASLYESFVIPFTIMLVLPLAACGAFFALFVTQKSLDLFSMIGCVMLLGISTKNSILLVDFTHQLVLQGKSRSEALLLAGRNRLRPILMTTVALIAGMFPLALGLNEASKQRTSMGVAVIGGLISSTLLTLLVVPAAYSFIDRFRLWSQGFIKKIFHGQPLHGGDETVKGVARTQHSRSAEMSGE